MRHAANFARSTVVTIELTAFQWTNTIRLQLG